MQRSVRSPKVTAWALSTALGLPLGGCARGTLEEDVPPPSSGFDASVGPIQGAADAAMGSDATATSGTLDASVGRDATKPSGGNVDAASVITSDAGGSPSASTDAALVVDAGSAAGASFPPAMDLSKDGPYKSMTIKGSGPDGNYTVYVPTELAPGGAKNPIVGWMSGGNTGPDAYPLLPRLATHGFVVVASNVKPGVGQEVDLGKKIIAGIDWALAEAGKSGSMFFGKLDTTKIASMGYSMGGLASFTIASDARLTTTVHISGGNMMADRVNNLRAPALFVCGEPGNDIAAANCDTDFKNAKTTVFYANFKGGHLGIQTPPLQNQIYTLATAWLRWKLMSDTTLDPMFKGADCSVCKDTTWLKVQQKN